MRFKLVARDEGCRVREDTACVESIELEATAGVGDSCVEFNHLVTRLFGDGVSAKVYRSRAPLKLGGGFCSASMAFSRDRIIRNNVSPISSDEEEETELSRAW